jgi:hypothetical protein
MLDQQGRRLSFVKRLNSFKKGSEKKEKEQRVGKEQGMERDWEWISRLRGSGKGSGKRVWRAMTRSEECW